MGKTQPQIKTTIIIYNKTYLQLSLYTSELWTEVRTYIINVCTYFIKGDTLFVTRYM